jgi:hypothetical protein
MIWAGSAQNWATTWATLDLLPGRHRHFLTIPTYKPKMDIGTIEWLHRGASNR